MATVPANDPGELNAAFAEAYVVPALFATPDAIK